MHGGSGVVVDGTDGGVAKCGLIVAHVHSAVNKAPVRPLYMVQRHMQVHVGVVLGHLVCLVWRCHFLPGYKYSKQGMRTSFLKGYHPIPGHVAQEV